MMEILSNSSSTVTPIFHKRMPPEAIDLASRLLQYSPSLRCTAVSSRQKEISRTTVMCETVETSTLLQQRAKLTCADGNQFHAVCLDTSHRIINLVERWNRSEGTHQVAYTFDAGPNAVMIAPNRKVTSLLLQRLLFYFPPPADTALASYVLGDQSIMHEAGVQSLKDIENLQAPSKIKDKKGSDEDDEEDDEE